MKNRFWVGLLLGMTLFLGACGDAETKMYPAAAPEKKTEVTVQLETNEETLLLEDGKTPGLGFKDTLPIVTIRGNEQATQAIHVATEEIDRAFVEGSSQGAMELDGKAALLRSAQEEFQWRQEDGQSMEYWGGYALNREVAVHRSDERVLSLYYQDYYYCGGVHGSMNCTGINYDTQTGQRLLLQDIAVHPQSFPQFCIKKLIDISHSDQYQYEGASIFFEDYEHYMPDVVQDAYWYLAGDGLHFIANQYVLACYAVGVIDFTIPYDRLQGVVKAEYCL